MSHDPAIEPVKRVRLSQQIVVELCRVIRERQFHVGDALPPERELADRFSVSRASVREALRGLEVAGIVETRHGGGTYVRDLADFGIESPLALLLATSDENVGDLWEMRILVEPAIAARAAARAGEKDVDSLDRILQEQREAYEANESHDVVIRLDRELHISVAAASGNVIAVRIIQIINQLLYQDRTHFVTSQTRRKLALDRHYEVVAAIRDNKPRKAADVMHTHLREVEEFILGQVIEERTAETGSLSGLEEIQEEGDSDGNPA